MSPLAGLAIATVLTLVPVTLLVPGLSELVIGAHQATRAEAHAFMAVNMMSGMLAVAPIMILVRRRPVLTRTLVLLLLADAALFALMGEARTIGQLLLVRTLDGAVHLPAVTLLMVAANRIAGERRGASLGVIAGSLMVGIAIGAPLGGALVEAGPTTVYRVGAALLTAAALAGALAMRRVPQAAPAATGRSRYRFDVRAAHAWMPLILGFMDRFTIGVFSSTFTLYLAEVLRVSPAQRGVLVSLFTAPFALLCWPAGRLADRVGWLGPMIIGNLGFGIVYASYGATPAGLLPLVMVASGVFSALMYAPNLVLVAEMSRRGAGEGLFGAFQIAGSLGFLAGPVVGGVLVEVSRRVTAGGEVAWAPIFALVGGLVVIVGLTALAVLRPLARAWSQGDPEPSPA